MGNELFSSLIFLSFKDNTNNLLQSKIRNVNYNININNTLSLSKKERFIGFCYFLDIIVQLKMLHLKEKILFLRMI